MVLITCVPGLQLVNSEDRLPNLRISFAPSSKSFSKAALKSLVLLSCFRSDSDSPSDFDSDSDSRFTKSKL